MKRPQPESSRFEWCSYAMKLEVREIELESRVDELEAAIDEILEWGYLMIPGVSEITQSKLDNDLAKLREVRLTASEGSDE